jgi:hypothetical protein
MHVDDLRDASRERLLAEIGLLQHQVVSGPGNQVKDLEMALLTSRDQSHGLAAQVDELVARNNELNRRLKKLRRAHVQTLHSMTWRIGRIVLLPVRVLKRLLKAS